MIHRSGVQIKSVLYTVNKSIANLNKTVSLDGSTKHVNTNREQPENVQLSTIEKYPQERCLLERKVS